MRFCPTCDQVMRRDVDGGAVVFLCACGARVAGGPEDARVAGEDAEQGQIAAAFDAQVAAAPGDPANLRVMLDCDRCGLDYVSLVRIGPSEKVVARCKCGHSPPVAGLEM